MLLHVQNDDFKKKAYVFFKKNQCEILDHSVLKKFFPASAKKQKSVRTNQRIKWGSKNR